MPLNLKLPFAIRQKTILLVTVVGCLLLAVTTMIAFGLYVVEKNQIVFAPLKTAVHQLQIEMDEVDRWVESVSKSQITTGMDFVWFQLDLSLSNLRSLLKSDAGGLKVATPGALRIELSNHLNALDTEISIYKKTVAWLIDPDVTPTSIPFDGIDYDHAYTAILSRLESMEGPIDEYLRMDLDLFRKLMVGGVVTCLLLTVLIATTFKRFIRQKADDYSKLTSAYDQLNRELAERQLAEESLQRSESLFRTVFETSPDAIAITRIEDNTIIDVNFGFLSYTGYRREEVVGKCALDINLWEDAGNRSSWLNEVYTEGFAENWEAVFRTKYAGQITCLLSTKKVDINGKPHMLTVARDISDRKRFEARIQAANQFLIIGNRHTEMQSLLQDFIRETKSISGCSAVAIRIIDEAGSIPHVAADGFDGDFCNLKTPLNVHSNKGMCARVINGQKEPHAPFFTAYGSYYMNDASRFIATATPEQRRLMRNTCHHHGYETIGLIPIRSGELTLGLFHVADKEADRLTDSTIEMLEAAALQLGTAIERVRAVQALRDSHAELEKRVDERTRMLSQAKDDLVLEVEKRKTYEQELLGFQQRLRVLSSRLMQTGERERRRIAIEIHDRIGQTLAVTKMQLGAVQAEFGVEGLKEKIETVRDLVSQVIHDVRSLTFELSPPILYELGLQAALEWLAENIRKQHGLSVEVTAHGSDRDIDLDSRVILFRTCSELLLNVVKHAGAKRATVHMRNNGDLMALTISDNGVGFDQAVLKQGYDPMERGFGLFSIEEQLQYYGGRLTIDAVPDRGSSVTVELPLTAAPRVEKEVSL